ncbi:MAG: sugar phosphate isomerase/epimerase [Clostridia bacterium]|nr:sugar phosphate isomerase/epimerase [Clostridia bacterium]
MKLGIITNSFKRGTKEAILAAKALGADGVQIYAARGDFNYATLTDADVQDYKKFLADNGMVISALCGDLGHPGFQDPQKNPERIAATKGIIDLAVKLDTKIVTTHVGVIPEYETSPKYQMMLAALREVGDYAHERGVTLAIETGPELATTLLKFVNCAGDGVGVNLDPANFVMVTGQDPAEAVYLIGKKIVHTHVKDGVMLVRVDPNAIYGDADVEDEIRGARFFAEVPVGEGSVNWDRYVKALRDVGYDGFLTIEREVGEDPAADIKTAIDFMKSKNMI